MADATVTGQVHLIEPTKTFGQKGFRKRMVVLEQTNGRFTNYLPLEFVSDACDSVDNLKVGDKVKVSYRLTGRKWQRDEMSEVKFFLSADIPISPTIQLFSWRNGSGRNKMKIFS